MYGKQNIQEQKNSVCFNLSFGIAIVKAPKIINALIKWLENTVKMCILFTILRDYMRRAGPVSRAGSVCRDLGTSVKHIKNQLCDYMEKSQPG